MEIPLVIGTTGLHIDPLTMPQRFLEFPKVAKRPIWSVDSARSIPDTILHRADPEIFDTTDQERETIHSSILEESNAYEGVDILLVLFVGVFDFTVAIWRAIDSFPFIFTHDDLVVSLHVRMRHLDIHCLVMPLDIELLIEYQAIDLR